MTEENQGLPAPAGNDREHRAPVTRLVIDRSRWLRGEGAGCSALLRRGDEKRCCLGFYGQVIGVPDPLLLGRTSPQDTATRDLWPDWLFNNALNTDTCCLLMDLNDDRSVVNREARIASIFAGRGVEVAFVDGPPPESSVGPKAESTSQSKP